jgi:hypothetical protein
MTRTGFGRAMIVVLLLGAVLVASGILPVSAHITTVKHTWKEHFKPKVEALIDDTAPWAVVASNGTLVRGAGATGASKPATGTYVVTFSRDISACSYTATSLDTASGSSAIYARVEVGAANGLTASQVRVGLINTSTATLSDFGFSLQLRC